MSIAMNPHAACELGHVWMQRGYKCGGMPGFIACMGADPLEGGRGRGGDWGNTAAVLLV